MARSFQPTQASSQPAGRPSLIFGAVFSAAFTIIFTWLIWAFTQDFVASLIPAFAMGGLLFGMWWFMSHRVRVEAREGRLH